MIQLQVFSSQVNELKEEKKKLQVELETRNKEMETRNKEMEEIKYELEKNKAAASKPIRSFWLTEPYNYQKKVESLKEELMKQINQEEEQQQDTCQNVKEQLETNNTENSSSSDSQETSGDIDVVVNDDYKFICLRNMSDQDKPLGGRQLKVQINNSEPITYTFHPSMKLKAGDKVTFCHPDSEYYAVLGDLMWEDLKSWKSGDRVQVSLQ
ncbi:lamin-A-like isoform X2 [Mugil cephalus]|uniref:lamin-A-like isoform X2 n=1 Tax=Mugil cephalus TaxID=48193 RepID=UPI001FB69468|nr:lamin-A-like isoform X2 [Mugil cephalus]